MSMPKSLRLIVVVASKPATGPWPMPGLTPLNSVASSTSRVTPCRVAAEQGNRSNRHNHLSVDPLTGLVGMPPGGARRVLHPG